MIVAEKVCKRYEDSAGDVYPVKGVDLSIPDGRFVSIVGRSGSGKSTLLKMLGGLLTPTEGIVKIDGDSIYALSEKEMANYRCNRIGFVFQDYMLEEKYTVFQNIEIVLMIAAIEKKHRNRMIEEALNAVGLLSKRNTFVYKLSGGEKQRVSIARAIVNQPSIIFADEPCGNLDWENGQLIMSLLRKQVDDGRTVVLITHNLDDAKMTDEIITLQDGRIINHEIL